LQGRILGEIAHLDGYGVAEQACSPPPCRRVREKQYTRSAIGVVLSGCFEYRAQDGAATVAQIALAAGFNDISHFNSSFRTVFGRSPTQWRAR
jgi:AraC-like DNA-binding protein